MPQTSPDFIFMLTNQDRTVADAAERLQDACRRHQTCGVQGYWPAIR